MLTCDLIEELRASCAEYGRLFRITYPDRAILTPKDHVIEVHIVAFASYFGTIGIFGEDGMEAIHPMDTTARVLVRSMRNAVQRHKTI